MKKTVFLALFLIFLISRIGECASYSDLMKISHNPVFMDRILYAEESAAIAVMNESSGTVSHAQRISYAAMILSGHKDTDFLNQWVVGVLTNSTIATEANISILPDYAIPDGDIQFTANSLFNAFAGIGLQ